MRDEKELEVATPGGAKIKQPAGACGLGTAFEEGMGKRCGVLVFLYRDVGHLQSDGNMEDWAEDWAIAELGDVLNSCNFEIEMDE